ncbi:AfsR/SARP family transcriptional regulator [Virgisporangium aurantiacum]|uniref:AfsR/SARP family transcriptional regulator n=1 Tax=Virgisporangium aurantiacum TaxID=175570 RepID=UPI00194E2279|nr:AfsR/SARP family transcriptional regulator [Virgisporangium aurantiacum]
MAIAGRRITVSAVKHRILLAALLVHANEVVSLDRLGAFIWSDAPPADERAAIQTYVTRLRHLVTGCDGETKIHFRGNGYQIEVDETAVDLGVFAATVRTADEAAAGDDLEGEAAALHEAMALWRDQPLADVPSEALRQEVVPRLLEWRMAVLQRRVELDLRLGRHAELVAELVGLTDSYPVSERLWAALMTALYRCGRRAEALTAFQTVRAYLADELGVDPGEQLRDLHHAVLNDNVPTVPARPTVRRPVLPAEQPSATEWLGQCRLPLDTPDLVGRKKVNSAILHALRASVAGVGVPTVAITGPPGVGKSALAVRVAHELRADYPDGQWFVRLDGTGADRRPPGQVLDELLRTAGVDPSTIPGGEAQRAGTLRARLADHRVLLVLDDAANVAQVAPLLPGTPGCAVLITSRNELGGLAVLHGALRYPLDSLDADAAGELLRRALGPQRLAAEPTAVTELAELCGRLPLALRIVVANLASRPHTTIDGYVTELRADDRLARLAVPGDTQIAVRGAFDLSYSSLPAVAGRAFRLLGLVPGGDFDAAAMGALIGAGAATAAALLETLASASLIEQHAAKRFRFHDLIRLYSAERVAADEPPDDRDAATRRLLDWYLHTAHAAARRFDPAYAESAPPAPPAETPIRSFPTDRAAMDWFDAERGNLVAAIRHAADRGYPPYPWLLFQAIRLDLLHRNHTDEWAASVSAATSAAEIAGDAPALAELHLSQGTLSWATGRYADADAQLHAAVRMARDAGRPIVAARALNNLGLVHLELGQLDTASRYLAEAAEPPEVLDAVRGLGAAVFSNLGIARLERGELRAAAESLTRAAAANRANGSLRGEENAEINLGHVHRLLGNLDTATGHLLRALHLTRHIGARPDEAGALVGLAGIYRDSGRYSSALEAGLASLSVARAVGHRRSESDALVELGAIALDTGQSALARDRYTTARELARDLGYRRVEAQALTGLALAGAALAGYRVTGMDLPGTPAEAAAEAAVSVHFGRAEQALALARQAGLRILEAGALIAYGRIAVATGRFGLAAQCAAQALALHRAAECPRGQAEARTILAAIPRAVREQPCVAR